MLQIGHDISGLADVRNTTVTCCKFDDNLPQLYETRWGLKIQEKEKD